MLRQLYGMSGEEIEIISAVDENPDNTLGPITVPEEIKKLAAKLPDDGLQVVKPATAPTVSIAGTVMPVTTIPTQSVINISERFYTDNSVDYKVTADGLFKKTWVDADPKLFRVINIKNNKESKLTNKKIQTMDWVKLG